MGQFPRIRTAIGGENVSYKRGQWEAVIPRAIGLIVRGPNEGQPAMRAIGAHLREP